MRFRFVDRILSWEPRRRICGLKAVSYAEASLREFIDDDLRLPDSLLIESLFQFGNWLIVLSSDFARMGLIVRARHIELMEAARPGDLVRMELTVQRYREDGILLSGAAYADGRKLCASEGCIAAFAPLEDYVDPEELRRIYRHIYRPQEGA